MEKQSLHDGHAEVGTCQKSINDAINLLEEAQRICECEPMADCEILLQAARIAFQQGDCDCARCIVELAAQVCIQPKIGCNCSIQFSIPTVEIVADVEGLGSVTGSATMVANACNYCSSNGLIIATFSSPTITFGFCGDQQISTDCTTQLPFIQMGGVGQLLIEGLNPVRASFLFVHNLEQCSDRTALFLFSPEGEIDLNFDQCIPDLVIQSCS